MKLILVRHGETEWNVQHRVQGSVDVPLNRAGREQAKKVGMRLKSEPIDVIYCSTAKRAKQTAAAIKRFHKAAIIYTNLINERKFGKMEGMYRDEYKKIRDESGLSAYLFRPAGGGENYVDIRKRVKKILALIKKKHRKQTVIVVSHGGIIRTFVTILTKKPFENIYDIEHHNASISMIELKPGSPPKVHYLNSTEHL